MKGFIGGIVTMILVLVLGLVFALMCFVNIRADNPPSKMESTLAGHAMDASVARAAPKLTNPVAADEASLVAGARLYRDHCTLCHGDPAHTKAALVDSLNPPPQFMDMADMPENQNFYILSTAFAGPPCPAGKRLNCTADLADGDIFSHMNDLPPAAKQPRKQRYARSRSQLPLNH
jgi:hypothetical protein